MVAGRTPVPLAVADADSTPVYVRHRIFAAAARTVRACAVDVTAQMVANFAVAAPLVVSWRRCGDLTGSA
jgi:hypothetical protein